MFTEPYSELWELRGSRHLLEGHVNVYEYEKGDEIVHVGGRVLLFGCVLSFAVLMCLLLCLRQS